MLTQTSEMAMKALIYLGLRPETGPVPPRRIAEQIGCSPSYLVKTLRQLVKAGILHSQRGAHGGVHLVRAPESITLLDVVEACQGMMIGNYCRAISPSVQPGVCAFHLAMQDVFNSTVDALSKWTLADLIAKPGPDDPRISDHRCKMTMGCSAEALKKPE